jgi:hypothetical protein
MVLLLNAFYHPLPIWKALLITLSSGVYLGVVGMTVANITRSTLAGYGAGLLFWFFEAASDGRLTAPFYLFIVSNQIDSTAGEVWRNPALWLPVKLGVLLLAAWLFVLNGWLLDAGPGRRRALLVLGVSIPLFFILGWWIIPIFV